MNKKTKDQRKIIAILPQPDCAARKRPATSWRWLWITMLLLSSCLAFSRFGLSQRRGAPVEVSPGSIQYSRNQNAQAANGWDWKSSTNDNIPLDAIVGGGEEGVPLYICRATYNGGTHPGKVRPGFGGCKIGWGGQEITVPSFEVLVPRWAAAANDNIPSGAPEVGSEAAGQGELSGAPLVGCHAFYQNGTHPGKVRSGLGGCKIGWGGKEITVPSYEVLFTGAVDYRSGGSDPILSGALVGGSEGGRALYICRARYNNGIHPGKFRSDLGGCNIGWGGKEVTVPTFTFLYPHWEKTLTGIEYEAGAEGGKPLYICRAFYQNGVHPGKYRDELGGCNIGWGGKEVTVSDYELLAPPPPPR
jgi:hypothetical protein